MRELVDEIEALNEELQEEIILYLAGLTAMVTDQLSRSATRDSVTTVNQDGSTTTVERKTVKTNRNGRVMREIDKFERSHSVALYTMLIEGMERASVLTMQNLMDEYDMSRPSAVNVDRTLGKQVRIGDKTMQQRARMVSSNLTEDIRHIVRQGIIGGTDVNDIITDVKDAVSSKEWELNRIIESEVYQTYRYQYGETADGNGYDWLRIHESFPRHPNRRNHNCYHLANANPYGRGAGVYRSTDVEIFYPHPQCTSYLSLVEVGNDA